MTNKLLIAVCVILLPVAVIGSYRFAKTQTPKPSPSAYDTLVDSQGQPVSVDPLNPNSKAEVVIDGPTEAKVGQLVRFDLSKSSGTMFKWKVIPSTTNFESYEGGRKAVFSADAPGEYTFVVACSLNGTVDVKTHTLKVGTGPAPPPVPTPTPGPNSVLASKILSWADAVNSVSKKQEAAKLGASFNSVADQIVPGQLTTPEEIITKTAESNRAALGTSLAAWVPCLTSLQAEMKSRADAGTLVTAEQHKAMWKEIASALRTYSST